jgi:quinol monooxygenase YgiN
MVIYEVNLTVQKSIGTEYLEWLREHIEQILKIDGFIGARLFEEPQDTESELRFVVHYVLGNHEDLEHYFAHHAEAMRRDGLERFPGQFTATRRILESMMEFQPVS